MLEKLTTTKSANGRVIDNDKRGALMREIAQLERRIDRDSAQLIIAKRMLEEMSA